MTDVEILIERLNKQEKLVCLLAPSFPIMFDYPSIVGKLKRLGFNYVLEVSQGAAVTNSQVLVKLAGNPKGRFITDPCPVIVGLVGKKYPQLAKYLTMVDSPMIATAKLAKEKYPEAGLVFIGPCLAKKTEAKSRYPQLNLLVLTFKEIKQVFDQKEIKDEPADSEANFDLEWSPTRLYPLSGGLVQSCGVGQVLSEDQIAQISGPNLAEEMLAKFETDDKIKLLDILYCEAGCIGGPGIDSPLSNDQRRQKVIDFWEKGIKS